jgi:5-methylthioadenosine/S-adenosylhomocysteine deaminase
MESKNSRRDFLKLGSALAGGAAFQALPGPALAQTADGDADLQRLLRARRIILKGGIVLTLDPQMGDFAAADVLIDDGKIRAISPNLPVPDDTASVDASDFILIPGFIDTHSHSYQGLFRSLLAKGTLNPDYVRDIQNNLTLHYQPADAYAGVLITALAMIDMGTTAIVDISQVAHTPEHSDAVIHALQDSGIRAVFAVYRGAGTGARYPEDLYRLRQTYFNSPDQLLTIALGTDKNPATFEFARRAGVRAVLHINDDSNLLLSLGRAGLLRAGDEFIHCTGLSPDAWRLIKDTGVRTSHCPPIEMAMGHGMPSIQEALDHGLAPSFSSDHSATVAQDMFGVMKAGFELQRLFVLQRARRKEPNLPPLLNPRQLLEFATIEGARCAALDGRAGTLSPGKDADIVLLRANRLDVWPHNNAYGTVVNLMNPGHVDTVFIAGKVKKWRGNLVGVDTARVMNLVREARDAVLRRGNFRMDLLG